MAVRAFSPGPGAYNTWKDEFERSLGFIGHSGRGKQKDNGVPGPGQYHIPVKFAWTPKYLLPNKPEVVKYI